MRALEKKYKKKASNISKKIRRFSIFLIVILGVFYAGKKSVSYGYAIMSNMVGEKISEFSSKSGFKLQNVYLEGQENTPTNRILDCIKIKVGDPILKADVWSIKKDLEKIEWVKAAVVDRELPGDLFIGIRERVPIGIGQYNKNLYLFDEDGVKIKETNLTKFLYLPVVITEDPGLYIHDLYPVITKDQELFKQISSVIRVSERRWNIRFVNEIEIKLPEYDVKDAWDRIIELNKNKQLFAEDVLSMDFRVPGKIFVEKK